MMAISEKEVIKEVAAERMVTQEVVKEVEVPGETVVVERPVELLRSQAAPASGTSTDEQAAQVAQRRIIVRTADMALVVDDVSRTIDDVSTLAESMGGWVVSSDRSTRHSGFVSVRVPADSLEETIDDLRELAVEVQSEVTTSKDVTDEYVDTTARLTNQQATQNALIRLLERAEKVEDALKVQNELTRVQEEIERLQGRIKFLEQTSAFSLVNVRLSLASVDMGVDAGADRTVSVGRVARFRATFEPPEGMEEFNYTWDFGDGNRITETRTAPTVDEGKRVTATVTHVYGDDRDSPFIVGIEITGIRRRGPRGRRRHSHRYSDEDPEHRGVRRKEHDGRGGPECRSRRIVHPAGRAHRPGLQVGLRRRLGPCHGSGGRGRDQSGRRARLRRLPSLPVHRDPHRHRTERRR